MDKVMTSPNKAVGSASRGHTEDMDPRRVASRRHLASSPFPAPPAPPPIEVFTEHDRVVHNRYGLGRVLRIEGVATVLVDFGNEHVRIHTPFRELTKL